MRAVILATLLLVATGCGKSGHDGGGTPTGEARRDSASSVSWERLSDDYQDDPARADRKYKGKQIIVGTAGSMLRRGGETVIVLKRVTSIPNSQQPDILLRFESEAELDKMVDREKVSYTAEGACQGLIGTEVVITNCRIAEFGAKSR